MANENFKVKFGLTVGDAATISGASGDIYTDGNAVISGNTTLGSNSSDTVTVNGLVANNITFGFNDTATPRGVLGQMSTGATDYWFVGGAETGGTSDAGYAMIATGDNGTEPIYARQYTGSPLSGAVAKELTLLDGSGNTSLAGDLTLGGNGYIYSTTDLALQLTGANVRTPGDLTVDGGDIIGTRSLQISTTNTFATTGSSISGTTLTIGTLTSGTISVGMAITGGTTVNGTVITANLSGTGSGSTWTVNTSQTVTSSAITGAGNITLAPITAGSVALTLANGGNLTNNRNYVHGAIRNATTQTTNGDIWEQNTSAAQSATNPYYRGLSLDNSADTTRGPLTLMRSYAGATGSGSASRGRVMFEKSRGTAASPSAVQSGDVLGGVDATGYTSTGWINDTLSFVPATTNFTSTESWVSNTNLGTAYNILLAPSATTITSGANLITCLSINPQTAAYRSDATTFSQGKSGSTTYASLALTGNTITALNAANTFIRQGTANITVPGLTLRYSRTDQTGSSDLDGVDFRLSTGGTTTNNNIARVEAQYRTSGIHEFGITLSSDNFVADADTVYFAKADKTIIRATPAGTTGTASNIMEITDANILNNRAHRNAITIATTTEGSTYSPAAADNNSISLTINTGSGTTVIDLANLTGQGTGGMYTIMVFNNAASGTPIQVKNTRINTNNLMTHTIGTGDRIMITAYIVGDYATAEHLVVA